MSDSTTPLFLDQLLAIIEKEKAEEQHRQVIFRRSIIACCAGISGCLCYVCAQGEGWQYAAIAATIIAAMLVHIIDDHRVEAACHRHRIEQAKARVRAYGIVIPEDYE